MSELFTVAETVDVAMVRATQQLTAPLELPPVLPIPAPMALAPSVAMTPRPRAPARAPLHPQTVLALVALAAAGAIVLACIAAAVR